MDNKPNKKQFPFFGIVTIIIMIIVLVAVGLMAAGTDGFQNLELPPTQEANAFYITVGGKKYAADTAMNLPNTTETRFDVSAADYTLSIIGNPALAFDFRGDGLLHGFKDIKDFAPAFDVVKHDTYFTINTTLRSMTKILQAIYPDKEITDVPADNFNQTHFFELKITSAEGKAIIIKLNRIGLMYISVDSIEVDTPSIIF